MGEFVLGLIKGGGLSTGEDLKQLPAELYTAEQVREMDRIAIEELGISGFSLMMQAGCVAFNLVECCYPTARKLHVFCGSGNNGGDGFVVASEALNKGFRVVVFLLGPVSSVTGDARLALDAYVLSGGAIKTPLLEPITACDVVIDALFGTGLSRSISGDYQRVIEQINHLGVPVIAIDIPSGLNADTGQPMGCAVVAQQTITFIGLKVGMVTGQASSFCGNLFFSSLEIPAVVYDKCKPQAWLTVNVSLPRRNRCAHKGDHGHVLLIGGDYGFCGAIRLASEASVRAGSGLVSVATRMEHAMQFAQVRPEIMAHAVEEISQLVVLMDKASVIAVGPGLGQNSWGESLFKAIEPYKQPKVVDADGLNFLAKRGGFSDNWILTPHPGEAARLMHCSVDEIQRDRYTAARDIQSTYGGVVVLKGPGTIITNGMTTKVTVTGNPGMACGGTGDVLTGIIAAFIAQNMPLMEAAVCGAFLHGKAGDQAAVLGERGLLASDLMPYIRRVVN